MKQNPYMTVGKNGMKQKPYMNGRIKWRETKPFRRKNKEKKSSGVKVNC